MRSADTSVGEADPRLRRRLLFAGLTISLTVALVPASGPAYGAVTDDVRSDANWILAAQLSDGAIANYVDRQAVWPYLANFAAMGLARATEVTKDRRYVTAAWQWVAWYQAHMDARGFVPDYTVRNGQVASTGSMDSTDSYAGTFLLAVRDAYRVTQDLTRLTSLRRGINAAVGAIEATQNTDGLTWAKPTWLVKYLMDQGESYSGLLAAKELAGALRDSSLASRANSDASRMRAGVAALWNATAAAYDWAVQTDGTRVATNWTYLYPDSLEQAWAVAFGLVDDPRQKSLMSRLSASQPVWSRPAAYASYRGSAQQQVGYWPVAGLAMFRVRDASAAPAVSSIRAAVIDAQRAWPFTTGNAGQLILLEAFNLPGAVVLDGSVPAPAPSSTTTPSPRPATPIPSATPGSTATPTASPAPAPSPSPPPSASPSPSPSLAPPLPLPTVGAR